MRAKDKAVAVLTADWHASHKVPVARAETRDEWYLAQAAAWIEVKNVAGRAGGVPILVAGDLLDRWDVPAELLNFMIDEMPHVYAVAGNHDLPLHSYDQITRSGYWTLVQAGKVSNLPEGKERNIGHPEPRGQAVAVGFPHGSDLSKIIGRSRDQFRVAVMHAYAWTQGCKSPAATDDTHYSVYVQKLSRFHDVILCGDNHQAFLVSSRVRDWSFVNAGCLMRRRSDERNYRPRVYVVYENGACDSVDVDTSNECWREGVSDVAAAAAGIDADAFLESLRELADVTVNFGAAVRRAMDENRVPKSVRSLVTQIVEGALQGD